MERKRWETAIRCLEIAVHPNTSNEEVVAAINGFRRTASGVSLTQLCAEIAGVGPIVGGPAAGPLHLLDRLDQVNLENRLLSRKLKQAEADRKAAHHAIAAAEERAAIAERSLAELRAAYGRISGELHHDNFDLQRALDEARRNLTQPLHEPVSPFRNVLNTALQSAHTAPAASPVPNADRPWTA